MKGRSFMRLRKRLTALFTLFALILALVPAAAAAGMNGQTVTFNTVEEMENWYDKYCDNFPKNLTINLPANEYSSVGGYYFSGIDSLTIRGNGKTRLLSKAADQSVLNIRECGDVQLEGLSIGHDPHAVQVGGCGFGTLLLIDDDMIIIDSCDIFGCGMYGLYAMDCKFRMVNSTVRDCMENAVRFENAWAYMENCTISGNGYSDSDVECIIGGVELNNCRLYNNHNVAATNEPVGFFLGSATFENCTFCMNAWGGDNIAPNAPGSGLQPAATFTDVNSYFWAYHSIERAVHFGALNGIGDGRFDPNGLVSTAQFAAMLTRMYYKDEVELAKQTVGTSPWWQPNINVAAEKGLLKGTRYATGMVSADAPISRYDMATMICNTLTTVGPWSGDPEREIPDAKGKIGDWAQIPVGYQAAVGTCYTTELLTGKDAAGRFFGEDSMTRAEAATALIRFVDKYTYYMFIQVDG